MLYEDTPIPDDVFHKLCMPDENYKIRLEALKDLNKPIPDDVFHKLCMPDEHSNDVTLR